MSSSADLQKTIKGSQFVFYTKGIHSLMFRRYLGKQQASANSSASLGKEQPAHQFTETQLVTKDKLDSEGKIIHYRITVTISHSLSKDLVKGNSENLVDS